jgi:nitrite reductase/ring-hydroxylating ferredoxin subunit
MGQMQKTLINVGALPDLVKKGRSLVKVEGKQIAVFKDDYDQIFAINNRCPHEGYSLIEGTLSEEGEGYNGKRACKLACNWHGWSFDLASGEALKGRDPVRAYSIEKQGTDYFIDLADIDTKTRVERAYAELEEATGEHDYERIARALCRLEQAHEPLDNVLVRIIGWSEDRFEQGISHPHAGLADWIALADEVPEKRTLAYLEAIAHFSWDGAIGTLYPMTKGEQHWNAKQFVDAIEAVDEHRAIQLARGGIAKGLGLQDFKPLFQKIIFAHYMGFGHPAIYLMKAEMLVKRLGTDIEATLIYQMTRYLTSAAREDLIPEFRAFAQYLEQNINPALDGDAMKPLSGDSVRIALENTAVCQDDDGDLWEHMLRESAINMLRFDVNLQDQIEQPIARNVGWLDFTHAITFAEAVKFHADTDPKLLRSGLLQMACFVGRNARYLSTSQFEVYRVDDHDQFIKEQKAMLFNMDAGEYIYSVHRLKMIRAVEALVTITSMETANIIVAALNKYLSSRLRMRHPERTLYQARETVLREG